MGEKKVKLRMGIHNKVTIDRWQAMKDDLKAGLPVSKIAKRHSVSKGTVRKVRRSKTYHEYRLREVNRHSNPEIVTASCGVAYEDFGRKPLFFSPKKVKPTNLALSNQLDREAEKTARAVGLVMLSIVGIITLALVIVFLTGIAKGGK